MPAGSDVDEAMRKLEAMAGADFKKCPVENPSHDDGCFRAAFESGFFKGLLKLALADFTPEQLKRFMSYVD